ncbi:PhnB protein [Seinonella peptonophila]|uniref:PhnB protein n=1 Tax=Seinonella peptonophila TaxID=112248 RepID=A0A1M4WFM7_9BACL|nr:VOC family protein [Seinonella peptonophila]SHE80101.1 PhnB protein [Seinonella peptonophila]
MSFEAITFLSMNGQGKEAIAFYQKYFQANILFKKTYKEMTAMDAEFTYPEGQDEYITHSVLTIGENKIMISDEEIDPSQSLSVGNNFAICIQSKDHALIEQFYHSLAQREEVTILKPFEAVTFSPGYAIIRDPFGIVFQLFVTKHNF